MKNNEWWRGGVIYQIYPRSFMDANNDGIGDLKGITSKLDYVAQLGVDAIWVSPFFTSPRNDFGYDIADYRGVDPIFGSLDDFKEMLAEAHSLGLKVIIDQVLSHSSDQHPWFQESRSSKINTKADWYVWADPLDDGAPPNNWLSFFGGSAWCYDKNRGQYYLHNFLASQPDLNFHNPEVRQAQLNNVEFWLELGVDGFRFDVVNFLYHSNGLENNPILVDGEHSQLGVFEENPYAFQEHKYDISQPENLLFLRELRKLLNNYNNAISLGEINAENALELMASYTSDNDKLHMAYTFDLLGEDCSASYIRSIISNVEQTIGDGWPCWALANHDVARLCSRWGKDKLLGDFSVVATAMLLSLRGSVCLYQGEELGLQEADIAKEDIVDPYGLPFWPEYKGRDGCRTPMVWDSNAVFAGFSEVKSWLPIDKRHFALAVDKQLGCHASTLEAIKQFILWRREQPALCKGKFTLLANEGEMLIWIRTHSEQALLLAFNLTPERLCYPAPDLKVEPMSGHGFTGIIENGQIVLDPFQAFVGLIKR